MIALDDLLDKGVLVGRWRIDMDVGSPVLVRKRLGAGFHAVGNCLHDAPEILVGNPVPEQKTIELVQTGHGLQIPTKQNTIEPGEHPRDPILMPINKRLHETPHCYLVAV